MDPELEKFYRGHLLCVFLSVLWQGEKAQLFDAEPSAFAFPNDGTKTTQLLTMMPTFHHAVFRFFKTRNAILVSKEIAPAMIQMKVASFFLDIVSPADEFCLFDFTT